MTAVDVKLALIFHDPEMERAFQESIKDIRRFRDPVVLALSSVALSKFYFQKISFTTPAQHVCGLFSTATYVSYLCLTVGVVLGHPHIFNLKPKLMPIISICTKITVKIMAIPAIVTRSNGGTLWQLLPVLAATSRAMQAFTGLGCWSSTGKTFFFDLAFYTFNQGLNLIWNRVCPIK
eukprot:jgi/Botrbrau1/21103/Bobra.0791s0001.1